MLDSRVNLPDWKNDVFSKGSIPLPLYIVCVRTLRSFILREHARFKHNSGDVVTTRLNMPLKAQNLYSSCVIILLVSACVLFISFPLIRGIYFDLVCFVLLLSSGIFLILHST